MLRQTLFSWRRAVFAPLAILALAIQCLVIQTHIDIAAPRGEATITSSSSSGGPAHDGGIAIGSCAVCQASLSGGLMLGAVPALLVAAVVTLATRREPRRAPVHVRPAHAWRSRAPPR